MATDGQKLDPHKASRAARIQAAFGGFNKEGKGKKVRAVPTLNEFAEDLIQEVGGSRNLARMLIAELKAASGQNKQRLLDTVTRVITAAAKLEGLDLGDASELSDEDLNAEFRAEVTEILEGDDGQQEEEADEGPAE